MAKLEGAGGEEWRNVRELQGAYDPANWDQAVQTARGRIADLRTRECELQLRDRTGRPLADRVVSVEQVAADFDWGFCGWGMLNQLEEGRFHLARNQHRIRLDCELFNSINLMHYWAEQHCDKAPQSEEYQGHISYDVLDRAVDWALGHGLRAKGHPIYWPCAKGLPAWLAKYDPDTRRRFLEVRVRQLVSRFRGRISVYDAVNEMMWEPTIAHTEDRHWPHLEPIADIADEAAAVIGWAREEDPDARYILNDYSMELGNTDEVPVPTNTGDKTTRDAQVRRFADMAQLLVERGQAPDHLGVQSLPAHWDRLAVLPATLDFLGETTGLPLFITEARTNPGFLHEAGLPEDEVLERLAEYAEAVVTIAFGNPHLDGFYFWGDWRRVDRRGRQGSAVYDRLYGLLRKRWWTREELLTDAEGVLRFRGFTGDYRLRVARASGQTSGYAFTLPASQRDPLRRELVCGVMA